MFAVSWQEYVEQHVGGLTQAEVAAQVGVSQSAVSRWRKGTQGVDAGQAIKFARAVKDRPLAALVAAGFITPEEARQRPAASPSLDSLTEEQLLEELRRRIVRMRGDGDVDRDATPIGTGRIDVQQLRGVQLAGELAQNAVDAALNEDAHISVSGRAVGVAARKTGKLSKGQQRGTAGAPDEPESQDPGDSEPR